MNCQRTKKNSSLNTQRNTVWNSPPENLRKQKCFVAHYKDIKTVPFAFKKLN